MKPTIDKILYLPWNFTIEKTKHLLIKGDFFPLDFFSDVLKIREQVLKDIKK